MVSLNDDRRLSSWKEIGAFFGKGERTVKRWEATRGLPVHRLPGGARTSVYAYVSELNQWLRNVGPLEEESAEVPAADLSGTAAAAARADIMARPGLRWALVFGGVAVLVAAIVFPQLRFGDASGSTEPPPARSFVAKPSTAAVTRHKPAQDVVDLYLNGLFYWNKRTPDDLNRAVHYFNQAISEDPNYAEAYVGLANAYNLLREYTMMPADEAYPRAKAAADRAIALDDTLSEAHTALAFVEFYWFRNFDKAKREFERARALDPNSVRVHHWFGTALLHLGEFEASLAELTRAQVLDPESRSILADKGLVLFYAGKADEAVTLLKQLATSEPDFLSPYSYLSAIYFAEGKYEDYVRSATQAARLMKDEQRLKVLGIAEKAFETGGSAGMLNAMLDEQKRLQAEGAEEAWGLARIHALLGDRVKAIGYLRRAIDKRDQNILALRIEPAFRDLHGNEDFRRLIVEVGLPPLAG